MKLPLCFIAILIAVAVVPTQAAPAKGPAPPKKKIHPHPVTTPWLIEGVEQPAQLAAVVVSLEKVPRFRKLEMIDPKAGVAQIAFDSHFSTYHQIAQAVADAGAVATLQFELPDYAKAENTAKIDEAMTQFAEQVQFELIDRGRGMFVVHFLPLRVDMAIEGPQGFNLGHLKHKIADAPPKGMGLQFLYEVHVDKDSGD